MYVWFISLYQNLISYLYTPKFVGISFDIIIHTDLSDLKYFTAILFKELKFLFFIIFIICSISKYENTTFNEFNELTSSWN